MVKDDLDIWNPLLNQINHDYTSQELIFLSLLVLLLLLCYYYL